MDYMNITCYNPSFGIKIPTKRVIELASDRWITPDGIQSAPITFFTVVENSTVSNDMIRNNYKVYSQQVAKSLRKKYPQIKNACDEIIVFLERNSRRIQDLSNKDIFKELAIILDKHEKIIGRTIDIDKIKLNI